MSNIKKLMMSAAGGGGVDVDDVFSTYLYTGNGTSQTITNGLDLAGEGGLIWSKYRSGSSHLWYDTERGIDYIVSSDSSAAQYDYGGDITSVNSDGFSLGYYSGGVNYSGRDYATWSFRKAPKFFDVITYTGNGVSGRQIAHNLGCEVGMLVVKKLNAQGGWHTFHRGATAGTLRLDTTSEASASNAPGYFGNGSTYIHPTSSVFTVHNSSEVNQSGSTYVAYLWAHNNGDGEFGPDSDQDIIKCGSYLNNNTAPVHIDLGWEPQWVLVKNATDASPWTIQDSMRGIVANENNNYTRKLEANSTAAETEIRAIQPTSTGFYVPNSIDGAYNSGNAAGTKTHIYMAIRRGSLFPPKSASEVFAVANHGTSNPAWVSGFPTDMAYGIGSSAPYTRDRLRGPGMSSMFSNAAEAINNNNTWDWQNGYHEGTSYSPGKAHMWKRAPGFFDIVAYEGNGTANQTFSHNLTVKPGMVWIKNRNRANTDYFVWVDDSITTNEGRLNSNGDFGYNVLGTVTDTTVQTLYTNQFATNYNGDNYIAYLFATLPGVSKVGSYTGNGSSQTINCGFTSGAKMVLTKRTDSTGNWNVWDSERGIVAGNDPRIALNDQYGTIDTGHDYIDPHNSGFIVNYIANDADDSNVNGASYIFYAIA